MSAPGLIAWGIEAILASTLLMIAVLALRGPVRRSFGPSVAYALWALPAARLLLPPLPADWRESVVAPIVQANEGFTVLVIEPLGLNAAAPTPAGPSIALLLLAAWGVGAALFIGWHVIAHARFCQRMLAEARHLSGRRVRVIETDAAAGPLAFGIWRKYVAFPLDFRDRYDADERALALAHELTHHARGDLIANWVALVVLALHWFNPIAWRAFRAFRADQEMACDARVLARRGPAYAHAYGRAIVKSAHGGAVSAACHLHTINDLKGRLKMLSTGRKSRLRVAGGGIAVVALTLVGLGATASGTQAAERLRDKVSSTIGVDIANLDVAAPLAPVQASGASGAVAPLPPSSAPQADLPPPPPPPPGAPDAPLAPPAPPAPAIDKNKRVIVIRNSGDGHGGVHVIPDDGKGVRVMRFVHRDKDGKVTTEDFQGMADIPEVSSLDCDDKQGDPKQMVWHGDKGGKKIIVICKNRIERVAAEGARVAANSKDIERHAYMSALAGLRSARSNMSGKNNAEAVKAIDEAIAEVEADMAKVN